MAILQILQGLLDAPPPGGYVAKRRRTYTIGRSGHRQEDRRMLLKQSTAKTILILLIASSDHIAGLASATLTINASKNGAAFAAITPTVVDLGSGWYSLALTAVHTDTMGQLALRITATSADPTDLALQVVAFDPEAVTNLGLTNLDAAITTRATSAAQANQALSTQVDALEGDTTTLLGRLTAIRAGLLDNLDAAISTRLSTAGYTAPDNTRIVIISKLLRNKFVTNPATGVATLYDDDNVTPLFTCSVFEDVAGAQAYRGQGAERRDRFA